MFTYVYTVHKHKIILLFLLSLYLLSGNNNNTKYERPFLPNQPCI